MVQKALTEIFQERVRLGSKVVCDEWKATPVAVKSSGSDILGTVVRERTFRNPMTGYHSNDAESEVARLKFFLRSKYGRVRATNARSPTAKDAALQLNIAEYVFYTNVGRHMSDIMKAFRHTGGVTGPVCGW